MWNTLGSYVLSRGSAIAAVTTKATQITRLALVTGDSAVGGEEPDPDTGQLPHRNSRRGHAFISYVREDSGEVDALCRQLEAAEVPVWRDTASLWPGENWRTKVRDAITQEALVFIACFSTRSAARQKSYQNEELLLAIDQLRMRGPDATWLIPVRFDDCDVPDIELGAGRTLASIHRADLFGAGRDHAAGRLVAVVQRLLDQAADPGGSSMS
jgi:hypothetical protein